MTDGRKTWAELIDEIAGQQGEPDSSVFPILIGQVNVPYFRREEIEQCLYDVSLVILHELADMSPDLLGASAYSELTATSGDTVPLAVINCTSAKIDSKSAVEVPPATWLQNRETTSKIYAFFGGNVYFSGGTTGVFEFTIEPALSLWQSDVHILPPGLDMRRISMCCNLLELSDYLPAGRI